MPTIGDVVSSLEQFAPLCLAEEWDNVGLLVGSSDWPANRVMTCLTITPVTVEEAIQQRAELIVTHHPLPFQPLSSITTKTIPGQMLLELIGAKIGVYSPHTAFDSAQTGINQHLAIGLGLQQIEALIPSADNSEAEMGAGRKGSLGEQLSLLEMAERVKAFLNINKVRIVGADDLTVSRVAIACGSGGSFLKAAIDNGCNCLVTGETNFHTCLEAEAQSVGLILPGHFASEQFALLSLADYLGEQITNLEAWASCSERDPLRIV